MAQYNINPPERRESGMGTVLAVLLVLALVAFLVWALAFGGFNAFMGPDFGDNPSVSAPAGGVGDTTSGAERGITGAVEPQQRTDPPANRP